jgi:hypothetical protein
MVEYDEQVAPHIREMLKKLGPPPPAHINIDEDRGEEEWESRDTGMIMIVGSLDWQLSVSPYGTQQLPQEGKREKGVGRDLKGEGSRTGERVNSEDNREQMQGSKYAQCCTIFAMGKKVPESYLSIQA